MWRLRGSGLELIYLGSGLEAALVLGPDRVGGVGGWGWERMAAYECVCVGDHL